MKSEIETKLHHFYKKNAHITSPLNVVFEIIACIIFN